MLILHAISQEGIQGDAKKYSKVFALLCTEAVVGNSTIRSKPR